MLNKNKFLPYLIASVIIHLIIILSLFFHKAEPLFLSTAIDVSFYSPYDTKVEPQPVDQEQEATPEPVKENTKEKEVKGAEQNIVKQQKKEDIAVKTTAKSKKDIDNNSQHTTEKNTVKINPKNKGQPKNKRYKLEGAQYDGVFFDNENFQYAYYANSIIRTVSSYWNWNESYSSLRAVVFFRIARNGTIISVEVKNSSGNKRFDTNAVNAVKRAERFAPLPESYKQNSLGVYFEFKYRG
jgi:TonB family protein